MHPRQFQNDEPDDLDVRLRDCLHRVRVPSGLAGRIQEAVRRAAERDSFLDAEGELAVRDLALGNPASNGSDDCVTDNISAIVRAESLSEKGPEARRLRRRRFLGVAAAASVIGISAGVYSYVNAQPLEQLVVVRYCLSRLHELEKQQLTWQGIREERRRQLQTEIQYLPSTLWLASECNLPEDNDIKRGRAFRINARNGVGLVLFELAIARPVANLNRYFVPLNSNSGVWGLIGLQERGRFIVLAGLCKESMLLGLVGAAQPI